MGRAATQDNQDSAGLGGGLGKQLLIPGPRLGGPWRTTHATWIWCMVKTISALAQWRSRAVHIADIPAMVAAQLDGDHGAEQALLSQRRNCLAREGGVAVHPIGVLVRHLPTRAAAVTNAS